MSIQRRFVLWLENHWVAPAYGGGLLAVISVCFFGAATNTMAGWLYVISGTSFALLGIAAILPPRSLRKLEVRRLPITPVSAGDRLTLEMDIFNPTTQPQTLLQVRDLLPFVLTSPISTSIEAIPPGGTYHWVAYPQTHKRGVYQWQDVQLRTGTPLGLFWCSRYRQVVAKAIVYPQVLPLKYCPLIESLGQEDSNRLQSDRRYQAATEGLTKALRPYRLGDPTRLIHWRTSARLGQLQVRELEIVTGGQEVIICLDSSSNWQAEAFEQAVIAAASLYFYASRSQMNVKLWTAGTGLVHGLRVVLETLAATSAGEESLGHNLPTVPLIWLTANSDSLNHLSFASRWLLFSAPTPPALKSNLSGLVITDSQPLETQLQKQLR